MEWMGCRGPDALFRTRGWIRAASGIRSSETKPRMGIRVSSPDPRHRGAPATHEPSDVQGAMRLFPGSSRGVPSEPDVPAALSPRSPIQF
jgi:hypothetical protein